ncbi:MAG: DUF202 domain-containing protein [Myxococcota bacterium]|nr:DUF202 domain-containing protein [Myxococcota bacterium]
MSPDLRFLQANERTLLAWVRTGLALMAFGFVIARLALWMQQDAGPDSTASLVVGVAVVATGAACQVVGAVRFVRARRALIEGRALAPGAGAPVVVAMVVAALGVALCAYLIAG